MDEDRSRDAGRGSTPESPRSPRGRRIAPIPERPRWRRAIESRVAVVVANLFSLLLAVDFLVTHLVPLYVLLVGWSAVAAHAVVVGAPPAPSLRASLVTRARRSPFGVPTVRDLAVAGVGLAAAFATLWGVTAAASALDAPVNGHAAMENLGLSALTLPVYVGAMLVVVGPVEEYLFRHLLQRRVLGGGPVRRVGLAGVAFGAVHALVYGIDPGAVVPIVALSLIGTVFGAAYELTGNLTVPALIHGCYNAALFLGLFLAG